MILPAEVSEETGRRGKGTRPASFSHGLAVPKSTNLRSVYNFT